MTFTGARICNTTVELNVLLNVLSEEGYRWASGEFLSDIRVDAPILLAFDARKKKVYYTTVDIFNIMPRLTIDPNLI